MNKVTRMNIPLNGNSQISENVSTRTVLVKLTL